MTILSFVGGKSSSTLVIVSTGLPNGPFTISWSRNNRNGMIDSLCYWKERVERRKVWRAKLVRRSKAVTVTVAVLP